MKRKLLILALAVIAVLSVLFAAAGCENAIGEFQAEFLSEVKREIYLSKDIDFDDYVKKVDGTAYRITVEYFNPISGKTVREEFSGNNMVFYPKMVGEHSIKYEVSSGRTTKTANIKISVISDPPTINISHTAQTINMPESGSVTRSFEYLMSNAYMTLKPVTATTQVVSAAFREVNVGLDSENPKWIKANIGEDDETFTFNRIGEYQFYVRATSENNYSEDYFLVNVIKDPSAGTKKSDGTEIIETARGVVFDENDPYTFKIMSSTLADVNYAVVADKLGDGKKLSLVFKGKNAPQLGFYVLPDEASENPYNIKTTKGGFFSFVAKESSGHKWVFFFPNMLTGNAARTPVKGKNDFGLNNFDDDKYYLMQYSLTSEAFIEVRNAWRLKVNVEIYDIVSYTTENENSGCVINDKLYEIGIEGQFYYTAGDRVGFDFSKGSSVIYGDIRNNIDIQYIADENNITKAPKSEMLVSGTDNVYSYKSTVTANADNRYTAVLRSGKITDDPDSGISDGLGYVGVKDSGFGMNGTIAVDFIGKNLPGIGVYLDNPPEGYVVGGATASGTGYYIGNGNVSGELSSIGRRLIVNGPNRLDPGGTYRGNSGYPPYYGRIDKLSYFGTAASDTPDFNRSAKFGYDLLEEGKKYRFTITDDSFSVDNTYNTFALTYRLYDMDGETPVLIEEVSKSMPRDFDGVNFASQTIAFFGSIHHDLRFSFSVFGEITPYPFSTETDEDVITLNPARISEVKDGNTIVGFSGTYDYIGLGEYNVGDVLEFRFTGNNIPNVALFTNENGVNPVGGGTVNTGIFVQTSGHGSQTFNKRLYITGPFLLDAGSVAHYRTLAGRENYEYKGELCKNIELGVDISNTGNTSLFGIDMLDGRTKYVYRLWTTASETEGKVVINAALFSVDGTTRTETASYTREITHYLNSLNNRYAVVYGAGSVSDKVITLAYTVNPED